MPKGNGSGPPRGGISGGGRGKMGGPVAAGPGGSCVCVSCGAKFPHIQGQPCSQRQCANCGSRLTRE